MISWIAIQLNFSMSVDIDECELDATLCDQVCENTEGSFFCTCFAGFERIEEDDKCQGYWCLCSYKMVSVILNTTI